jgi:hypothetical protein
VKEKLPFGLESIASQVSNLKLRGGLAGKICHVLIFVALAMAIVAWSVQIVWVSAASLGLIFILAFVMLWRLINLADKNPQSALMEGAELLIHEQLMIGKKGAPEILVSPKETVELAPLKLTEGEKTNLNQPEEQQGQLSDSAAESK